MAIPNEFSFFQLSALCRISKRGLAGRFIFAASLAAPMYVAFLSTLPTGANAAVVSACTGVSLPPSVVTGLLAPVFGALSIFNLGNTLTGINNGAPVTLQVLDTSGNVVSNSAPCFTTASGFQLDTPAGIAFGGNQITGLGNGVGASAADIDAIAIGNGAITSAAATKAVAIGFTSSAFGAGSIALGANATANNAGDIALGNGSITAATVGTPGATIAGAAFTFAGATPISMLSVGDVGNERIVTNVAAGRLSGASTDAVNGSQLFATNSALNNISTGGVGIKYFHANSVLADSLATGVNSIAVGPAATATMQNGVAMGSGASASAINSVALGANSVAVLGAQTGYTGYGLAAAQTSAGEVSVGAVGASRKVTNVAAGSAATDAVNVSQLNQVGQNTAASLGGGAAYNPATGIYTAPSYSVGGITYDNVGGAIGAQNMIVQGQGTAVASLFGPAFTYNPATGTVTGQITYNAVLYPNVQAVFNALSTQVNGGSGNKYFHANSLLADATASGTDSTSMGPLAVAAGNRSLAAGVGSLAVTTSSVAIGDTAVAMGGSAVSIGASNIATGNGAVAIGDPNIATGAGAVAVGANNTALGQGAVALGNASTAGSTGSLAIGNEATASATDAIALGSNSIATNAGDIALGSNSVTSAVVATPNAVIAGMAYTFAGGVPVSAVSFGAPNAERQLQNVAAAVLSETSTNAVNGSQLFATNTALETLSTSLTNVNNGGGIKYFHSNSTLPDSTASGINSVAIGPAATTAASATDAIALGNAANAGATGAVALGSGASTATANSVALGADAVAGAADGGWAGTTVAGTTFATNALNANAVVGISGNGINRQIQGLADGAVTATSTDAINGSQLFYSIQALSTAVAAPIAADNVHGLAGPNVIAGQNGLAIGYGATSSGTNSVALGNGSTDTGRANVVSVGSAGATRQVINLSAGIQPTDAINVSQLQPLVLALGGGSAINSTTGAVTGPSYTVGGTNYNNVGSAISATNRLSVQYTPDVSGNPTNAIVLSGANNGQAVTVSNVAAGVNTNDAVNVGQLKAVSNRVDQIATGIASLSGVVDQNQAEARRGIATSAAMANLPFGNTPGKWSSAVSFGGFKDQTAVAMGIQYNANVPLRIQLRATGSFVPGTNGVTFGGGVGLEF